MTRQLTLTESREQLIELGAEEASVLEAIGRKLASTKAWWGQPLSDTAAATVIAISRANDRLWRVTFRDVVGAVQVGDTHLRVIPKIAPAHFGFLLSRSSVVPRVASDAIAFDKGVDLESLVARWFVQAAETLLKRGLRRDYEETTDELGAVRGSVAAMETAMNLRVGRPLVVCTYSELGDDSPLNRLLKAAAALVVRMPFVDAAVRDRARRIHGRLFDVGILQGSDMRVWPDRLSHHYAGAIPLAKLLIEGAGASSSVGGARGTAFLLRTPELIEDGLRNALSERLEGENIRKRQLQLGGAAITINPDLVFEGRSAVGDVKYRRLSKDWDRGHFNQVVTFATGFQAARCAVIGFTDRLVDPVPQPVRIGQIDVAAFPWVADSAIEPTRSRDRLAQQVGSWLGTTASVGR